MCQLKARSWCIGTNGSHHQCPCGVWPQVGQAVDFKEHDIWWHGVAWEQSPGMLRIFLPGAPGSYLRFIY